MVAVTTAEVFIFLSLFQLISQLHFQYIFAFVRMDDL